MKTIALVAPNVAQTMGGEAIKAFQYARYLLAEGHDVRIFCHARCRAEVEAAFDADQFELISDDWRQIAAWRSVILRPYVSNFFHRAVASRIATTLDPTTTVIHYIAPVSPATPRYPPKGFDFVVGPMTGNIYYPPGFADRMTLKEKLRSISHSFFQRLTGMLSTEKTRASALLVSGYERTRASLKLGGGRDDQMLDVIDSGVNERLGAAPRQVHAGRNHRFVTVGRLIPYKGYDLAIRAIAATEDASLDIFGEGDLKADLQALTLSLGVGDRVRFCGRLDNNALADTYAAYRAFVFPTLAEANGIVMQEAMMVGLPVITLRWGGPVMLADDKAAEFIEPVNEDQVVRDLASRMILLAEDPDHANSLASAAREIAEEKFAWPKVAASWMAAYPD